MNKSNNKPQERIEFMVPKELKLLIKELCKDSEICEAELEKTLFVHGFGHTLFYFSIKDKETFFNNVKSMKIHNEISWIPKIVEFHNRLKEVKRA